MQLSRETVTPKKAMEWLKRNVHNRPLSDSLVRTYVTTMKAGSYGEAEFNALTGQYTIEVLDPFATPKYSHEQCETAVVEAKAIVDAAQAAAPAAPATDAPAAPAADAPAAQ